MQKEIPILFSTAMVQALLASRKTQTRRIVKPQNSVEEHEGEAIWVHDVSQPHPCEYACTNSEWSQCPYGKAGDVLYVKEKHYAYGQWEYDFENLTKAGKPKKVFVVADGADNYCFDEQVTVTKDGQTATFHLPIEKGMGIGPAYRGWYKRNSLFMPKAAARIWLQVESIKVERAQDISEADAEKEGAKPMLYNSGSNVMEEIDDTHYFYERAYAKYQTGFQSLWQSINGAESWNENPFVWVVSFKVLSTTGKPFTGA